MGAQSVERPEEDGKRKNIVLRAIEHIKEAKEANDYKDSILVCLGFFGILGFLLRTRILTKCLRMRIMEPNSHTNMSPQNELEKIHTIYLMQMQLWDVLDGRIRSPEKIKAAQKQLREYKKLLQEVDWRYMGGEDVLETLENIQCEAEKKLKERSGKLKGNKK